MAVTRNPKPATQIPPTTDERKIEALINKGGSSTLAKPTESDQNDDKIKTVPLRAYESELKEIDELLLTIPKRNRPSRNTYFLQAIRAQLQRDKSKRK